MGVKRGVGSPMLAPGGFQWRGNRCRAMINPREGGGGGSAKRAWGGSSGSCSWSFGVWNPAVEVSSDPSRAVIWGGRFGIWGGRFGIGWELWELQLVLWGLEIQL